MSTTDAYPPHPTPSAGDRRAAGSRRMPWTSGFDRSTATSLAASEYERLADLLGELTAEEWRRPTECRGWDVRAMAGHCVGMAQMATGLRTSVTQQA